MGINVNLCGLKGNNNNEVEIKGLFAEVIFTMSYADRNKPLKNIIICLINPFICQTYTI